MVRGSPFRPTCLDVLCAPLEAARAAILMVETATIPPTGDA